MRPGGRCAGTLGRCCGNPQLSRLPAQSLLRGAPLRVWALSPCPRCCAQPPRRPPGTGSGSTGGSGIHRWGLRWGPPAGSVPTGGRPAPRLAGDAPPKGVGSELSPDPGQMQMTGSRRGHSGLCRRSSAGVAPPKAQHDPPGAGAGSHLFRRMQTALHPPAEQMLFKEKSYSLPGDQIPPFSTARGHALGAGSAPWSCLLTQKSRTEFTSAF